MGDCKRIKREIGVLKAQFPAEYTAWKSAKARCTQPVRKDYWRYGGRGIIVCDRWFHHFDAFLADLGPMPTPAHTLDRIDNTGHYEPGNCRWATQQEQQRNRSNNRRLTFNGRTMLVVEWSEHLGILRATLSNRLNALQWPLERALSSTVDQTRQRRR